MPSTPRTPKADETHLALDVPDANAPAATGKRPRKAQDLMDGKADPKLPHERDESVGMTDGAPSPKMRQAHQDLSRGLQDTGRGPEADRAYKKLKR